MKEPSTLLAHLRRAPPAIAIALSLWMPGIRAHAGDSTAYDDTANCIALMQTNADALAWQIKAGDKAREPALRSELRRAGVLIGRTYLDGLRDSAEAKARLKAAQERQSTWDEARKRRVYRACINRADAELAAASGPQRFIVERYARAQYDRMLGKR